MERQAPQPVGIAPPFVDVKRQAVGAGGRYPPGTAAVLVDAPKGAKEITLTFTVDDPNADPPTDAKVMLTIEASDNGGKTWYTVSSSWGGTSGVMSATIPMRGRQLRWHVRADAACTVDIAGSAV